MPLIENCKMLTNDFEIAETFNKHLKHVLYDQWFFITKFFPFLKRFSLNIKLASGKASVRKAVVAVIEKLENSLDKGGEYVALLTCLKHLTVYHRI